MPDDTIDIEKLAKHDSEELEGDISKKHRCIHDGSPMLSCHSYDGGKSNQWSW